LKRKETTTVDPNRKSSTDPFGRQQFEEHARDHGGFFIAGQVWDWGTKNEQELYKLLAVMKTQLVRLFSLARVNDKSRDLTEAAAVLSSSLALASRLSSSAAIEAFCKDKTAEEILTGGVGTVIKQTKFEGAHGGIEIYVFMLPEFAESLGMAAVEPPRHVADQLPPGTVLVSVTGRGALDHNPLPARALLRFMSSDVYHTVRPFLLKASQSKSAVKSLLQGDFFQAFEEKLRNDTEALRTVLFYKAVDALGVGVGEESRDPLLSIVDTSTDAVALVTCQCVMDRNGIEKLVPVPLSVVREALDAGLAGG
jgi:hypothetical protein